MTPDDDFISQLEGYLDEFEGITPLPSATRDAVRVQLPATKQIAWRFPIMPNGTRIASAGFAVVLVAVVGVSLLSKAGLGPFAASPSPTAGLGSFAASPSPTRYVVGPGEVPSLGTHRLTFLVPEGWTDVSGRGVRKNDLSLTVWVSPHGVWINPCYWTSNPGDFADPPMMRDLKYLADAFWDWWGAPRPIGAGNWAGDEQATLPRGTAPMGAVVDQYAARYVEFRVPADLDLRFCNQGEYRIWIGLDAQIKTISAPGELNQLWILKVGLPDVREGGFVIVDASSFPESSAKDRAELQAMVDSIRIE
jgi:hypothetical protein